MDTVLIISITNINVFLAHWLLVYITKHSTRYDWVSANEGWLTPKDSL